LDKSRNRVADQQQVIANLVTVDSEIRLSETLRQLAKKFGKKDPRSIRIELRISHEELATMVGTRRPRISVFMQRFRILGLIGSSIAFLANRLLQDFQREMNIRNNRGQVIFDTGRDFRLN